MCFPISNHTMIPNEIFDKWAIILPPSEYLVLTIIARKTCGLQIEKDKISISQLVAITGLSKQGVIKAIQTLIKHGIVKKYTTKEKDKTFGTNTYEIMFSDQEENKN